MGVKRLLGKVQITDSSSVDYLSSHPSGSTNFRKVDFVTCVYDETEKVVECFDVPFNELTEDSRGFSGDYADQTYNLSNSFNFGNGDLSNPTAIWVIASTFKAYVVDDTATDIIKVFDIRTGEYLSSENFGSGVISNPTGIYIIESTGKAYIANGGSGTDITVFDISDGTHLSSEDFGSGASIYGGIWIKESTGRAYISDWTNSLVTAWDITDGTAKTGEDFGSGVLSNPDSIYFYESEDRAYVADNNTKYVHSFTVSTQTHNASEAIKQTGWNFSSAPLTLSSVVVDETTDKLYVTNTAGLKTHVFDISIKTTPVHLLVEDFEPNTDGINWDYPRGIFISGSDLYIGNGSNGTNQYVVKISIAVFPATLVYPRARDLVTINRGTYWTRSIEEYSTQRDSNFVHFQRFTSPPYFLQRTIPISQIGDTSLSYNLDASIVNHVNPTGKSTADGSIEIEATGTQTPFIYQIIGGNNSNESPQASGTFATLYPGVYRFRVTDANGVNFDIPPFYLKPITDPWSAYGILYYFQWYDVTNSRQYRIEIVKKAYSGGSTKLDEMAGNFFSLSTRGEGGDVHDISILSTEATISFVHTTLYQYIEIAQGHDEQYGLIFYIEDTGFQERWRGFISPRSYSEGMSGTLHTTSYTATDRTGDLKNIDYLMKIPNQGVGSSNTVNTFYGGKKNLLQILHFCLRQLNLEMGYRIALDLFEDSHNMASTDNPLTQTKTDTDTYFEDEKSWTLEKVVKAILDPNNAILISWGGYFYIIDKRNFLNSSISYVEYSNALAYVGTGSWSPIIDFKTVASTTKFRWIENPAITTTEVYKDIELTLDTKVIESLTPKFIGTNVQYGEYYAFEGMTGFIFDRGDNILAWILKENGQKISFSDGFSHYTLLGGIFGGTQSPIPVHIKVIHHANTNSTTKLVNNGDIEFGSADKLRVLLDTNFQTTAGQGSTKLPYFILKWKIKIGEKYFDQSTSTWTATDTTNTLYINEGDNKHDIVFPVPDQAQALTDYSFSVFAVSPMEYDITSTTLSGMKTAVKALPTVDLVDGTRVVARREEVVSGAPDQYYFHYYELLDEQADGSEPDVLKPSDYNASTNAKQWRRAYGVHFKTRIASGASTFKNIELKFMPNGEDIPEEVILKKVADDNHLITLEKTLHHFDAPPETLNAKNIYYNHFFTGDDVRTDSWYKTGGLKRRIQDHLICWLARLIKKARFRVSGSIHHDTEITPLNVLRDPGDDNKIYLQMGVSYDFKMNKINGEFVEVGSDVIPESSSFTTAFDSTEIS